MIYLNLGYLIENTKKYQLSYKTLGVFVTLVVVLMDY